MGVVFFLFFLVGVCSFGVILLGIGICGSIFFGRRTENRAPRNPPLAVVSKVAAAIGGGCILLPLLFLVGIALNNILPPADFVSTDAVIAENGYQDTRFTVDGVVYEVLDMEVADPERSRTAVFAWITEGFFNGAQRGNYFEVVNGGGFRLVCDHQGKLFCPTEERDAVLAYYRDPQRLQFYWSPDGWETPMPLSESEQASVSDLLLCTAEELPTVHHTATEDRPQFLLLAVSRDGAVQVLHQWFVLVDGEPHLFVLSAMEEEAVVYELAVLPSDLQASIKELYETNTQERKAS
ncbi:MAG: hypothetical protein E7620_03290 [Ruminococcaceae bacterium]|nr:hypothetical protein [Oscillospiraceae bacterium]